MVTSFWEVVWAVVAGTFLYNLIRWLVLLLLEAVELLFEEDHGP